MSQDLKAHLQDEMKNAMRARAKDRLLVIRGVLAAIKQREIDEQIELDDTQVLVVLDKLVKQRRDSAQQFRAAQRSDLSDKEEMEMKILQEFLPTALTESEITQMIEDAINVSGAQSMKDMGKVMGLIKSKAQGRADMSQISGLIKQKLS
ncbi:MAG: GatB/YqeY domain-containing protein [gamma proteobacterium symbiont of Taylorina sp.]|nr:GatB/YqeY domain-containing protein [gamma proteobacterium symbiont of Taylorina sp.]